MMVTIDIGCVLVNELSRLQVFTAYKRSKYAALLKVSNIFLRTQLEFQYS